MRSQAKKADPYEHLSGDARAAMAAVDTKTEALPSEGELKFSIMEGDAGGFGQRPPDEPPNAGAKVRPSQRNHLAAALLMELHPPIPCRGLNGCGQAARNGALIHLLCSSHAELDAPLHCIICRETALQDAGGAAGMPRLPDGQDLRADGRAGLATCCPKQGDALP